MAETAANEEADIADCAIESTHTCFPLQAVLINNNYTCYNWITCIWGTHVCIMTVEHDLHNDNLSHGKRCAMPCDINCLYRSKKTPRAFFWSHNIAARDLNVKVWLWLVAGRSKKAPAVQCILCV